MTAVKEFESCLFMLMLFVTITSVLTKFIEGRAYCLFLFINLLFICSVQSARPAMIQNPTAKVLILDDFHPAFTEILGEKGIDFNYRPDFNPNEPIESLLGYNIIAVRSKMDFTADLMNQLPDLKCIARGGAGMDNIDEVHAEAKGITLLNAPEGNRDAVAEHTIGLLLALSNNIVKAHNEVADFVWKREANRGWEIGDKTIGIFGYGNTGSSFARKISGFGCKVIAYDKYLSQLPDNHAEKVDLKTLLQNSDVISFHVPLTNETNGLINRQLISRMKTNVVILNTSRGKIGKLSDVLEGINSGKIRSFAADVLENENFNKLTDTETTTLKDLITSNQVIITPHVAGWTTESYRKIAVILAKKILDFTMNSKLI